MTKNFKTASQKILAAKSIAIISHINPDGDTLGSALSLGLGLKRLGKKVYLLSQDGVPQRYKSLPGAKQIVKTMNKLVDLAIAVDCNAPEMLGKNFKIFSQAKSSLEIDHHSLRRSFAGLSIVDIEAASVGELIYKLLDRLNVPITKDIAQNILTSIIVETNSFRLPNVKAVTFQLCTKLMATGLDFYKLAETVYWSRRKETSILVGLCVSRAKFLKKGKIVWSWMKKEDLTRIKAKIEDADSVANELLAIKGVEIAIFFREKDKKTLRVSLRSKGHLSVAKLAEAYGGGGHFDSAGCQMVNSQRAKNKFLRETEDLL